VPVHASIEGKLGQRPRASRQGNFGLKKGKHYGIRNARQYRSAGFETLLRNHDIRERERALQGDQLRWPGRADELVKTSIDGGINFFDTVDNYTEDESEKILGQSLKHLNVARNNVVIATKVYSRVGPGWNDIGASRGHIMDGVEASLRRLQTDHIDLYQIHGNDSVTPVVETIRALDTLVQQGKVRYVGCSNRQAWKIAKALGISEFRNLARFATLQAIAKAHGCSPARLSLAWLLAKPVVTSVIVGAKRPDQLQDNLAAVALTLTPDELRQLDEVSALPPEYPGWVLALQGADRLEPVDRWERFRETTKAH
jgi:aryl-alcohol dehydrogenase-like predicted oxidoreductase